MYTLDTNAIIYYLDRDPAVVAALWIAIRLSGTSFSDYLALRGTSWLAPLCEILLLAVAQYLCKAVGIVVR